MQISILRQYRIQVKISEVHETDIALFCGNVGGRRGRQIKNFGILQMSLKHGYFSPQKHYSYRGEKKATSEKEQAAEDT